MRWSAPAAALVSMLAVVGSIHPSSDVQRMRVQTLLRPTPTPAPTPTATPTPTPRRFLLTPKGRIVRQEHPS